MVILPGHLQCPEKKEGWIGGALDDRLRHHGYGHRCHGGRFQRLFEKTYTPLELGHVVKETFLRASLLEENARLKTLLPLYHLSERFIFSQSRQEVLDALVETVEQQMDVARFP